MPPDREPMLSADRRSLLKWTTLMAGATGIGLPSAQAQQTGGPAQQVPDGLPKGMLSFMLAHEQFPVSELVQLGAQASRSGFHVLSLSDHFQPWQANQGHTALAWVTMGALG